MTSFQNFVIPAQAGIQPSWHSEIVNSNKPPTFHLNWIPACAGMTGF